MKISYKNTDISVDITFFGGIGSEPEEPKRLMQMDDK